MTQNSNLKAFRYELVIMAEDQRQADRVVTERTGYDEDLRECGVGDYQISASTTDGREMDPVEPDEDTAEQEHLKTLVRNPSDIQDVSEDQICSFTRINTVLGGGTLPMARLVDAGAGETGPVLAMLYRHNGSHIRLRLDADGSLLSMEAEWGDSWLDMDGGPLHALVVDALSAAPVPELDPFVFTARNGMKLTFRNNGLIDGPNPGHAGWTEAMLELFELDKDAQCVTWRWPEDENIVVIRNETTRDKDGSRWTYAYNIRTIGEGSWYCSDRSTENSREHDNPMHTATHAYYRAVPMAW